MAIVSWIFVEIVREDEMSCCTLDCTVLKVGNLGLSPPIEISVLKLKPNLDDVEIRGAFHGQFARGCTQFLDSYI